jgi:large subunit ribosomal protein L1
VDEALIKKIEAGEINFDVLITEPRYMPQLAKFAKVLGPKGLMPNPKNGTVTANPELKKQELEGGKITIKGEKKAPLMHVSLGKTSAETKALVENLQALETALRGKLLKMSISATMSPSVKVTLS